MSFEKAKEWVKELQQQGDPNVVVAFVGNKVDMESARRTSKEVCNVFNTCRFSKDAQMYCDQNALFYIETSAKTATNVAELFMTIGIKNLFEVSTFDCTAKRLPKVQREREFGRGQSMKQSTIGQQQLQPTASGITKKFLGSLNFSCRKRRKKEK